jgi:hypothetical protein
MIFLRCVDVLARSLIFFLRCGVSYARSLVVFVRRVDVFVRPLGFFVRSPSVSSVASVIRSVPSTFQSGASIFWSDAPTFLPGPCRKGSDPRSPIDDAIMFVTGTPMFQSDASCFSDSAAKVFGGAIRISVGAPIFMSSATSFSPSRPFFLSVRLRTVPVRLARAAVRPRRSSARASVGPRCRENAIFAQLPLVAQAERMPVRLGRAPHSCTRLADRTPRA